MSKIAFKLDCIGDENQALRDGIGKVKRSKHVSFKAKMLQTNKRTKVVCIFTPKVLCYECVNNACMYWLNIIQMLNVRELRMKIQCRRLYACRISPSTKVKA
jgi:hypothetical protein